MAVHEDGTHVPLPWSIPLVGPQVFDYVYKQEKRGDVAAKLLHCGLRISFPASDVGFTVKCFGYLDCPHGLVSSGSLRQNARLAESVYPESLRAGLRGLGTSAS